MYTTDAIVLKKTESGEADALFTLYTKEYGKIRALAQGVRKNEAKLKGHLEPLNLASISFVLGKNGERLTHAALINPWPAIWGSFEKLKAAHAVADLADKNTMPGERDPHLWELLLRGFEALERSGEGKIFLERFKQGLISVLQPEGSRLAI